MRLFGFNISRTKAVSASTVEKALSPVDGGRGWWSILESFPGAWQRNVEINRDSVLSNPVDFACRTLIASDIAKLRIKLVKRAEDGTWVETKNPAYSPVLRKPNDFQNIIQFLEYWLLSKLQNGNAVILKQRDIRGVVVKMYVLDWRLVTPLVADDGSVFYQLNTDNISGIGESVVVPAREIIHDRFNCFFHPLIGLSPIFASGLASTQALAIQNNSTLFFQNGSRPSGILTAVGTISEVTAKELKDNWTQNYSGKNAGKVAVLGDGLKYEPMSTDAVDAQLIEQLKWSGEVVCSTYHVPPYKVGLGQLPANANIQALNTEYYSQCLQIHIESIELCLDEGLGMGDNIGTEIDVDNLLRMDSATQMEVLDKGKNVFTPNEARRRVNLPPVLGGNSVYRQQQDFSLEALAKRDAQEDPFSSDKSSTKTEPPPANVDVAEAKAALLAIYKGLSE